MAYTQLRYHFNTATKCRRRLILPEVELVLYPALYELGEQAGGKVLLVGGISDHVHLLAAVRPDIPLTYFMRDLKKESSKIVRAAFPDLDFGWQDSFGAFTVDPMNMDGIAAYIRNQKQHHNEGDLWEKFEVSSNPKLPRSGGGA